MSDEPDKPFEPSGLIAESMKQHRRSGKPCLTDEQIRYIVDDIMRFGEEWASHVKAKS